MRSHCVVVLLLFGAIQSAGCLERGSSVGSLTFSPDGRQICYLKEDRLQESIVDGKILSRTISLHWCRTSDLARLSSTEIEVLGLDYKGYINVLSEVKWSKGGSWIAVLTPHKLTLVDTSSGKKREISDGKIWSFAWISDTKLGYSARRTEGKTEKRVICLEDVRSESKTEIAVFQKHEAGGSPRRESWSPSGEFVLLMDPDVGGQFYCVNIINGARKSFGQADAYADGIAWSGDSARVFCVSNKVGPNDRYEALLYEPETNRVIDCTKGFVETFAGNWPDLEPMWTVDNQYCIANTLNKGGYLIQPYPWKALPLGTTLAPKHNVPSASKVSSWLFWLPVSGWIGVLPTGNEGDSPVKYAADYEGQHVIPLADGYPRAMSPDGTMMATIGNDGRVQINNLGKWWLRPATTSSPEPGAVAAVFAATVDFRNSVTTIPGNSPCPRELDHHFQSATLWPSTTASPLPSQLIRAGNR